MIQIDGSMGEGGGQVLRSSLALSILTDQPFRITNIRSKRSKPGLRPQHLTAVEAAAGISRAQVSEVQAGSTDLSFHPGPARAGRYRFYIPTAGAATLVLQTIALPLAFAPGLSTVTVRGGTHVPWSPCYHYLEESWNPMLARIGITNRLELTAAGFYPQGGGKISAKIYPTASIQPLNLTERGRLVRIRGISGVANLDDSIARRQKLQALRRLQPRCRDTKIKSLQLPSQNRGTFLLLKAEFEHTLCCYCALGAPGKRAEKVADEAVDALESCLDSRSTVDEYLADQLLLPLSFAQGQSTFATTQVTQHLLTNAQVLRAFLPVEISIQGEINQPGQISILPPANFL